MTRGSPLSFGALVAGVLAVVSQPTSAQTILWTEASMVGYGSMGIVAGALACDGCGIVTGLGSTVVGGLAGMILGHEIGSSAERGARQGELTNGQLWGARVGMVTGFAGLGFALAARVSTREPTGESKRMATYSLAGALVGVVAEIIQEANLPMGALGLTAAAIPGGQAVTLGIPLSALAPAGAALRGRRSNRSLKNGGTSRWGRHGPER